MGLSKNHHILETGAGKITCPPWFAFGVRALRCYNCSTIFELVEQ